MDACTGRRGLSGPLIALVALMALPTPPALAARAGTALDDPLASPRLEQLRGAASGADTAASALAAFWAEVHRDGAPLIEPAGAEHPNQRLVTFLYQSAADTHVVILADFSDYVPHMTLQRLAGTDVWSRSFLLPDDARFLYELSVDDPGFPFTAGDTVAWPSATRPDPLNPHQYDFTRPQIFSLVELPRAPSLALSTPNDSVPHGALDQRGELLKSAILGNERKLFLYTPPGYRDVADAAGAADGTDASAAAGSAGAGYPLLIFGASYINQVRLPVILDNLIAAGRIPPVVAVFVGFPPNDGGRNVQDEEAGGGAAFGDFIAQELLPWVRQRVRVSSDPRQVVIGGASAGGHSAACVALQHPEAIGAVIAQSGAFWRGLGLSAKSWGDPARDGGREGFARLAASSPIAAHGGVPVRFELTIGSLECGAALSADSVSMLHASRHVRDVLQAKGYPVTLRENSGGHDPFNWETSLPDVLVAVLGSSAAAAPAAAAAAAPGAAPSASPPAAGARRIDARGIEQVWVPPGSFRMGTDATTHAELETEILPTWVARELPSECPAHEVALGTGFWIDRCEVSNAAFAAFVADGGYTRRELWSEAGWSWLAAQPAGERPAHCAADAPEQPRAGITWFEAEAYAHWRGGRLPTEAEWEYAARGPRSLRYPWGDDFEESRCTVVDAKAPTPVGSLPDGASWVGALDLSGNLMEWVSDWLDVQAYEHDAAAAGVGGATLDPQGPASGKVKVEKGGWWGAPAFTARAAYRHFEDPPEYGDQHIGARVVSP